MIISKERLLQEAESSGFRPEILEKVIILMRILEGINKDAYLCERLVLKGGTALNLFYFGLPRLSVDIDLNYIGAVNRDVMLVERPKVEERIERICKGLGLTIYRKPTVHAGGKMIWRYSSVLGNQGNVEIDLNYMYRIPLVPISIKNSVNIAEQMINNIGVLDIHELSAGKLSALVDRGAARDFFDAHFLLHNMSLNDHQLRVLFVIYSGMSRKCDVRKLDNLKVDYDEIEFQHLLVPMLKKENINRFSHVTTSEKRFYGSKNIGCIALISGDHSMGTKIESIDHLIALVSKKQNSLTQLFSVRDKIAFDYQNAEEGSKTNSAQYSDASMK